MQAPLAINAAVISGKAASKRDQLTHTGLGSPEASARFRAGPVLRGNGM